MDYLINRAYKFARHVVTIACVIIIVVGLGMIITGKTSCTPTHQGPTVHTIQVTYYNGDVEDLKVETPSDWIRIELEGGDLDCIWALGGHKSLGSGVRNWTYKSKTYK